MIWPGLAGLAGLERYDHWMPKRRLQPGCLGTIWIIILTRRLHWSSRGLHLSFDILDGRGSVGGDWSSLISIASWPTNQISDIRIPWEPLSRRDEERRRRRHQEQQASSPFRPLSLSFCCLLRCLSVLDPIQSSWELGDWGAGFYFVSFRPAGGKGICRSFSHDQMDSVRLSAQIRPRATRSTFTLALSYGRS